MPQPTLADLVGAVVVLRDRWGQGGRFIIDHVHDGTAICSDVLRGRGAPPVRWQPGDELELGAPAERGWLVGTALVDSGRRTGAVVLRVDELQVVQRRDSYREELVVPLVLRRHGDDPGRAGRTDNLSTGGFAARVAGTPFEDGAELLVSLSLPDGDDLVVPCRKLGGDLLQRFGFADLPIAVEERIARVVRTSELARRRAAREVDG